MAIEGLTSYQDCFIRLGYIYRNYESNNKDSFWRMFKMKGSCVIEVLASSYVSLVQLKEVCTSEDLKKSTPDEYDKYDTWARKFFPDADEDKINKIIKALIAFKYFKNS